MDQLFKDLPRDLQWEILTEFVGTHTVRKGKLIRKIVCDARHQMIRDMVRIQTCCGRFTWEFKAKSFVQFSNGDRLMFCYDAEYGGIGYMFRSATTHEFSLMPRYFSGLQWTPINIWTGIASPFEKHAYPSYEDTDKKKAIRTH